MPAGQDSSLTCTVGAGANLSSAMFLGGSVPYALQLPAAGWTASNINFLGSLDGVNFYPLATADAGADNLYTLTSASAGGRLYALNPNVFGGLRAIKVNSVTPQVGASTLVLGTRDVA